MECILSRIIHKENYLTTVDIIQKNKYDYRKRILDK